MNRYRSLLSTLTLGTARQPLPAPVGEWLAARAAVDPTADDAERLLAAWAVHERLERLGGGHRVEPAPSATAPPDDRPLPSPKINRGVELIMRGTYPHLLPETLRLLADHQIQFPPFLLPELLERAVLLYDSDPQQTDLLLRAAGRRGQWLARLNPDWAVLTDDYDLAAAWKKENTPGKRLPLLKRWRAADPAAARDALAAVWAEQSPTNQETLLAAFAVRLSDEDHPWLREQLGPKRRGVRRALFKLLLRGGEEQALNAATELVVASLTEAGKIGNRLPADTAKTLLLQYGGPQKKESLTDFLLDVLPPALLPDLLSRTGPEFWQTLRKSELRIAAKTLLRYDLPELDEAFVRFAARADAAVLPATKAAELTARLPQERFVGLFHELLDTDKSLFHFGSLPRLLVLSRTEAWSERITKAVVLELTRTVGEAYALPHATLRDLQLHWRLAVPLVHPATFGWLRTQLHRTTERGDGFGKLATELLQTTALRREIGGAAGAVGGR